MESVDSGRQGSISSKRPIGRRAAKRDVENRRRDEMQGRKLDYIGTELERGNEFMERYTLAQERGTEQEGMEILLQMLPKGSVQYKEIAANLMRQTSESGAATEADSKHVSSGGGSNMEQAEEQSQGNEVEF